jgi:transcriptional/translational regulatory protein YebC/TACO1
MVPTTRVEVADEPTAKRVLRLIELLEEHDDVQSVWANFDIPDEILERAEL